LLSISNISSSFFNTSSILVPGFASIKDISNISFSSLDGKSFFSHISSLAQIIQLLSTHLIAVFFIITGSHSQCHKTLAQILATATHCQISKLEPQHTI